MTTQTQTYLEKAFLSSVAVLLLLATVGQSAEVTTELQATATPPPTVSPMNNTTEQPRVLHLHKPCGSEHETFCANGGTCVYPQDNEKPFCICTSSFVGPRCMLTSEQTMVLPEFEKMIAVILAVVMLLLILAIVIYCLAYRRCVKSAPLIKSAPSEISV
ncbi:epigen-like [Mugil cephalus]|uniref:epigen-like n=1 Tax=Mugil cephalus TaxID=48193 RepID=UPI001FB6FA72|nr:epigen-like [Mugil cephalus]